MGTSIRRGWVYPRPRQPPDGQVLCLLERTSVSRIAPACGSSLSGKHKASAPAIKHILGHAQVNTTQNISGDIEGARDLLNANLVEEKPDSPNGFLKESENRAEYW